jgi:Putative beta-barrel porin-2, OmpL-like. bbp2/Carboxypeptidase regulatory-like domain
VGSCLWSCVRGLLLCVVAMGVSVSGVRAEEAAPGTIVGVVTNSSKLPVPRATVTAVRVGGTGIRATVSGSDGMYSFPDLPSGTWRVTLRAEGYSETAERPVEVAANRATRYDVVMMQAPGSPPAPPVVAQTQPATVPPDISQIIPEALQTPAPGPENDTVTPLANVGDIGWMNGTTRTPPVFDTKLFTPEIRFDVNYIQSTNQPRDHTIVGSTEEFRSGEFQIEQVSFGGDFHWNNVRARFLSMMGQFATATTRNDASAGVGQWDLQGAYKYFSEANAGYHWDVNHGLNLDAGIFVSYIGLFSYYNFDNWTYQPSYVSSNTPWFFNGLRIQWWPTQNLKIEPWLINGWQSNAKYNSSPGFGGQILWIPSNNVKWVFNTYLLGQDNQRTIAPASGNGNVNAYCPGISTAPACGGGTATSLPFNGPAIDWAHVRRFHEDDSFLYKFYDQPKAAGISKVAMSLTWDFGCEYGGGLNCLDEPNKANFFGIMEYTRLWLDHNLYAVTVGGGMMTNPGRYLTLLPPINGASAATGSPYFTETPGQKIRQWDVQLNLQWMPKDWITWWSELTYRHSNVPYWAGSGGVTPPNAGTGTFSNNSQPAYPVCNNGASAANVSDNCAAEGGIWFPDLRTEEWVWGVGVMVKF